MSEAVFSGGGDNPADMPHPDDEDALRDRFALASIGPVVRSAIASGTALSARDTALNVYALADALMEVRKK